MTKLLCTLIALVPSVAAAADLCDIRDDIPTTSELRERSQPLTEYAGVKVRAAAGKVRCEADDAENRLVCITEGRTELLVDAQGRAWQGLFLTGEETGEVHVYASGDTSCGAKSEFDRYR